MSVFNPTVSQRLIWLDQAISKGSSKYNIGGYAYLKGHLSYPVFNDALKQVLSSQEAYATRFREEENGPICITGDAARDFAMDIIDFSGDTDPGAAAIRWLEQDFATAFEVENNYLFRFQLLKISEQKHYWYAKMHHLISDGWSFKLLLNQAADIYSSLISGKEIPFTVYRYSDYAREDESYYHSDAAAEDRAFWLNEYRSLPAALFKRHDNMAAQGSNAESETLRLEKLMKQRLQQFADAHKISVFHLVTGLFLIYFSRTGRQREIAVGIPVLNRTKKVYRYTSGVFMNLLSIKFPIAGDDTLISAVNRIKQRMSAALRHQRYQYGNLVKDLKLLPGNLLYDIRISYEEFDFTSDFGGLEATAVALTNHAENDKLAIYLRDYHDEGFDVRLVYSTAYFDRTAIRSVCRSLRYMIESLSVNEDIPVASIPLIDPEERKAIMAFSVGPVRTITAGSFLEMWEQSVQRYPAHVAVSTSCRRFTYAAINEGARQVAALLYTLPEANRQMVALLLPRSEKMIIGILGSMMAGCTYIPLDPEYPAQRIAQVLQDAGCSLLMLADETKARVPDIPAVQRLYVDDSSTAAKEMSGHGHTSTVNPARPCYIIYTSGSTGTPKGVCISHRSLADYTHTFREYFQVDSEDTVLQQASISFDTSAEEIFPVLSSGGRLHILEERRDMDNLLHTLAEEQISILSTTPLVLHFLNHHALPSCIRLLISGGDVLKPCHVNRLLQQVPVYNTYGPTESTICATYYRVQPADRVIPIGQPIPNREAYILDDQLQLMPFGVEGEIYLGGAGLALEYLHDEALTREAFTAHFPGNGQKLYRTGDMGVMRADGNLLFAGRRDEQLNYRGYRIAAYEVEKAIHDWPRVEDCLVMVKDFQEIAMLTAYVQYENGNGYTVSEWRTMLRNRLPAHMIPEVWITVAAFPLLPTGKVNRNALPDIQPHMLQSGKKEVTPPRTQLEHSIYHIWKTVLLQEVMDVEDSFFELGGHSLNIMKLINSYYRVFKVKLSVRELFQHTSIASHAVLIAARTAVKYHSIEPVGGAEDFAVSDGQKRLWVLSQLEEGSKAYHLSGHLLLEGAYTLSFFEQALRKVVERHEILRTVFREDEEGVPRQVVLPVEKIPVAITYSEHAATDVAAAIAYIKNAADPLFDLSKGPLWCAGLLRWAQDRYIFYYTMHHIISDGWSMELLKEEIIRYYQVFAAGQAFELPALRIQYKDYAAWQQRQLQEGVLSDHRQYWLQQLKGPLPVLDLPTGKARPPVLTHNGHTLFTVIDGHLRDQLYAFCREHNGTLFMGLLAVLKLLFYRYTGQTDMIIGTPVAGREHAELEDQIGFYINTLALRTRFAGDDTLITLFEKIREVTLGAYEHQAYPFDRLTGELEGKRDISRSAMFDVIIILQNQQDRTESGRTFAASEGIIDKGSCTSKFDLSFDFLEKDTALCLQVEFNTDVYDKPVITRFIAHYEQLLAALLSQPDTAIDRIDHLPAAEKQLLLEGFNQAAASYPRDKTLVDLFREQAAATPDHTAVTFEQHHITYRELDEKSDRLACYLQRHQVKADTLVPLCVTGSIDMIVCILGILKAGGAYVPIDPEYPAERIAYVLSDIHANLVVTHRDYRELFPGVPDRILIDELPEEPIKQCIPAAVTVQPDQLAYIIYTSGSTGRPKGVMITHRNVVRLFNTDQPLYDFKDTDTWTLFHSYCFDFSVWEIFGALLHGARLVVVPRRLARDTAGFAALLQEEGVTILNQTPHAFYILSEEVLHTGRPLAVRYVIFGGEALNPARLKNWKAHFPQCRLVNMYGITETTVHVTYKEIDEQEIQEGVSNIGKAIPTLSCYVLNNRLQLLPAGMVGELYVGGEGVARGYLNREELNRERFIANPYREGERLYRTGDLGKWLENGDILYLGRADDQIKVRGYRVEPGEIEQALLELEGIRSAAVMAHRSGEGPSHITAYVVSEQPLGSTALKAQLSQRLPEHMIPSFFVQLEKLPLTPNGKVNKQLLPLPAAATLPAGAEYIAPRNAMEQVLVDIFRQILHMERISVKDNFFDLGGNSMLLMQVRLEMKKQLGVHLNVRELYRYMCVEEIAQMIDSVKWLQQEGNTDSKQKEADLVV